MMQGRAQGRIGYTGRYNTERAPPQWIHAASLSEPSSICIANISCIRSRPASTATAPAWRLRLVYFNVAHPPARAWRMRSGLDPGRLSPSLLAGRGTHVYSTRVVMALPRRERDPEEEIGALAAALSAGTLAYEDGVRLRSSSRTHRKPMLLFRSSGSFLLRFETRRFAALLFHEPPRSIQTALPLTNVHCPNNCSRRRHVSPQAAWPIHA